MLGSCSPLPFFFALVAVIFLPLGMAYRGFARSRREGLGAFDHGATLLTGLFFAALASIGGFIVYIFFHGVGC